MKQERIITYDLGADVITSVADFIDTHFISKGKDLSRIAIIFGGERPSLFLKRELAQRIKSCYFSPRFFTMDAFIDYILIQQAPFTKISEMDACYMIYIIAKHIAPSIVREQRFSEFLPWAREVMLFIDQLDMDDISNEVSRYIQEHATIGYDVPESINALLEHLIAIRERYHARMLERKSYARGFRYRQTSRVVGKMVCDEFETLLFCNFFFLHETEKKILSTFYKNKNAFFFFNGSQKDWPVLAECARNFQCAIEPQTGSSKHGTFPSISFYAGFDVHSQMSIIQSILKQIPEQDNTVIVLPNPDTIIPLLSEITSDIDNFNVSMGYPLKRSSFYSLCELIFKAQETRCNTTYYARDYLNVIRHPLIKNLIILRNPSITRVVIHKIEEILLGLEETDLGGQLFFPLQAIEECTELFVFVGRTLGHMGVESITRNELKSIIQTVHLLSFTLWEGIHSFAQFAKSMETFLDTLIRLSFLKNYPLNISVVKQIFSILDEFMSAEYKEEVFEEGEIFKLFTQYIEGKRIAFKGTPLKGLQILGLLETRALNFKNVIIMDVNEGVFPHVRISTPLIPREIMTALGLTSIEREEEIQRYHFMRLIESAQKVFIIYDDREDKEKSRFIEELLWRKQKDQASLVIEPVKKGSYTVNVMFAPRAVKKRSYIIDYLKNDFIFSATSINTYIKCPLRFYYQYVLHLREKEDFLEEPEGSDIGTFIHSLLEDAYKPFIGKKPDINKKFINSFLKIFTSRFEREFTKKMKSDSFMVQEVMCYRLKQFLENEQQRQVDIIHGIEKEYTNSLSLGRHSIKFTAKVDRIDEVNGTIVVIDYKTGGDILTPANIKTLETINCRDRVSIKKKIRSFQLPLYIYFVKNEYNNIPLDAALYNIRTVELVPFSSKIGESFPFTRSIPLCMNALCYVIEEILDPTIPFMPDNEEIMFCKNCPFQAMCCR